MQRSFQEKVKQQALIFQLIGYYCYCVLSCTIFVLKQRELHSTSKQFTKKKGFVALRFFLKELYMTHCHLYMTHYPLYMNQLHPQLLLPPRASGITTFSLTHYHPPQASGITTFSRTTRLYLCFSQPFILVELRCRPNMGQYILFVEQVSHFIYC